MAALINDPALEEVRRVKAMNVSLMQENAKLRKGIKDPVAAARRELFLEAKQEYSNEIRRRDKARQRVVESGLISGAAESPLKRAMGGVWMEATARKKVRGGKQEGAGKGCMEK